MRQRARETLEGFVFVFAREGWVVHNNRINGRLQLQVDVFCKDMIDSVRLWAEDTKNDPDIKARYAELLFIRDVNSGIPGLIQFGSL